MLAKKMPEFRANEAHIKSHHGIHKGEINADHVPKQTDVLMTRTQALTRSMF